MEGKLIIVTQHNLLSNEKGEYEKDNVNRLGRRDGILEEIN